MELKDITQELYRYERDIAKETYVAARDSMKAIQVQINALQSILKLQSEV